MQWYEDFYHLKTLRHLLFINKILSANNNIDNILPNFISLKCKTLLKKILNTNPRKRYTIEEIKDHPWFHLVKPEMQPGYLMGEDDVPIDQDIVEACEGYDIKKDVLIQNLKENKHDHNTTSYYLLLKKTNQGRMKSEHSIKLKNVNQKRDLNHSVQYSMKSDDLKSTNATIVPKSNLFSNSDQESVSLNFNSVNPQAKKRRVLECFNLVTVNRKNDK